MSTKPQIWAGPPWNPDVTDAQANAFTNPAPDSDAPPAMANISMGGGAPPVFAAPTPNVTRQPTPIESQIGDTNQRLQKLQQKDANPFGSANNHPGVGGHILHALSVAGNIAGDIFAPETMALIPGTDLNRRVQEGGLSSRLQSLTQQQSEDEGRSASTAKLAAETAGLPTEQRDKHELAESTEGNLDSESYARQHPQSAWKELPGFTGPNGEPLEIDAKTGQTRVAPAPTGTKSSKEANPQEQTYDALLKSGMTPVQAYEKIRERVPGTSNAGTWQMQEDAAGKPVMFNSKTGETRDAPPGLQKAGTKAKADAAVAPVQAALDYANDYVPRDVHTGPGDEALMEKFFELAKPSTGFRMSQQQIDMLKNAQSWMGGIEAHLRHATTGTWFSDQQRKEISDTMNDLGKVKGLAPKGGTSQPSGGAGGASEIVYDDKGVGHRYKGTGDRGDPNNYEAVKK